MSATVSPGAISNQTSTVYTEGYIGGEDFLLEREIYKGIFDRYRENEGLVDFLLNTSRLSTSATTSYNWWEHGYLLNSAVIESGVIANGQATNDKATIVIEEVSHQTANPKHGSPVTGDLSPFMVGDTVMIAGQRGRVMVKNTSTADAHIYTIYTIDQSAWTPGGADTIATRINKIGNAHADGTLGPDSSTRVPDRFTNYTQIFKNMYEAHGSESANRSEVNVKGVPYYYKQGVVDVANKHALDMENTFFFGVGGASLLDTTAPDGTGTVHTTDGLDNTITDNGIITTLTTGIAYSDLEDIAKALTTERAEKQYIGMMAVNLYLDWDSALHTRNTDTTINYSMFGKGSGAKSAVDFDYKSYSLGGYTMHLKQSDTLNYEPVTGGTDFEDTGYLMPMTTVRDGKDKKKMHTMTLMTKKSDKVSRWMNEYERGQKETGKDSREYHLQCEGGLRLAKSNSCVKITV